MYINVYIYIYIYIYMHIYPMECATFVVFLKTEFFILASSYKKSASVLNLKSVLRLHFNVPYFVELSSRVLNSWQLQSSCDNTDAVL